MLSSRLMKIKLNHIIPDTLHHHRLDVALSQLFPDYSRSQMQQWIKQGDVQINGCVIQKTRHFVSTGETITIDTQLAETSHFEAQSIPLSIIFEDEHVIVINKPVGLVVHPGAGNADNTLLNALLHHAPELALIPRAGIIHRLDKDTSGLLVIARTLPMHHMLIKQMQQRKIHRGYRAIVQGRMISGGTIDAPMGRHPQNRTKMAVTHDGKKAVTHYRVIERFRMHTLLNVELDTGRTHQIRVHLAHLNYPIVGDLTYGKHRQYPNLTEKVQNALKTFRHQALHAYRLSLTNPVTKVQYDWLAPLPDDFSALLELLTEDSQ